MATSAGYVRDSLVMASLGKNSEYQHLERILLDAVCTEPIAYDELLPVAETESKYSKYKKENYVPQPHYQRDK